jgi:glutamate dehydrogenase
MNSRPTGGSDTSAAAGDLTPDDDVFRRRYLAHATSQLPGRSQAALAELAAEHLRLGLLRPDRQALVRVHALDDETSALDVVTTDAPYLVDSIRSELARAGVPAINVLHPQLVVSRDDEGTLLVVHDIDDTAPLPDGANTESWMHVEIERVDHATADGIGADVVRVLSDVRYAAEDAPAMYGLIRELAERLKGDPGQFERETSSEAGNLLRWLADGNYLILGHATYSANELASLGSDTLAEDVRGVLRGEATVSPLELLPAFRSGAPLVIFKSPLVSTVRRSARYDCVTVVTPSESGDGSQSIHVFLGLITNAEDGTVARVPVVRKRIAEILQRSGVRADSHTGRELVAALRTLPRDELLEAPTSELLRLAQLVVDRAEHGRVGVFARVHLNRDFVTVLVYFAAGRFGPETRDRVADTVLANWPGEVLARDDRLTELGLARMHFLIALTPGQPIPSPDRRQVEAEVVRVTRRWSDDLADLLTLATGADNSERLLRRYIGAFPEAYKEDFGAAVAVRDIARLEQLPAEDGLGFEMYTPSDDDEADQRLKVFRTGLPLSLARALPIFNQMGIEVLNERPYEMEPRDGSPSWIYDFGLRMPAGVELDGQGANNIVDALRQLWRGETEQDGFNALVVRGGLTSWQVNLLRAYAKYLRQAGSTFSQGYIEQALIQNAPIARRLVQLFEVRFDPAHVRTVPVVPHDGEEHEAPPLEERASLVAAIEAALVDVTSLDQDRIIRSFLGLINATVRTNAYRRDAEGRLPSALAFKLDPRRITDLPEPRPRYEIWVYSPRVEGVHLRFGLVARGGLRWSDRQEDFRTEVLGLVKAQMVKNAVIVPVGSKGGFVVKQAIDPSGPASSGPRRTPAEDRDAWLAEGIACYKTFIGCLLDVTDNYVLVDGKRTVQPPPDTRRYDGDDPYLVVAADKGTAAFSDLANDISLERGFWLGDAFASGGSVGYDHKVMGITARGAWESVKYHFRELDLNTQTRDFTVVGIGDMSGDVFGNGMLLSEHIRLVAAFDHRHVFLDPTPDPATSLVERRRLFELPRSSWADYDSSLLSAGGGVYPRSVKSIPIAAPVRAALGLADTVETLTPNELIRAILLAPVDLLWNGGIGTYVKAAGETNAAAGDKANDAVRVDGGQLRARVVGEGGNLGLTQLGRIEYARAGGKINTDAIDNSAGVDTSDHEVNIKILLDRAVAHGEISQDERNELLLSVTNEVADLVLRDNYEQNVLLGVARRLGVAMIGVHGRFIKSLESAGDLDRKLEFLPSEQELQQREAAGQGLTTPEVAVVAAYSKIVLAQHIEDSTLPDEPWFARVLAAYFPARINARFQAQLSAHPLHREIITTAVVNDVINRGGSTFVFRAVEETGVDPAEVLRAATVAKSVFGLDAVWSELESLDNVVPIDAQHAAYQELRRLLDRATRWLVDARFPISDIGAEIDRFGPPIARLLPGLRELLRGEERANVLAETNRFVGLGLPGGLASRVAELLTAFLLLDVVEISISSGRPVAEVAELHFTISERFSVDEVLTRITRLPRDDRWSALARAALRHDVYAALSAMTSAVLRGTGPDEPAADRLTSWEDQHFERVARARATLTEALGRPVVDLATLSVALRVMRGVSGAGA